MALFGFKKKQENVAATEKVAEKKTVVKPAKIAKAVKAAPKKEVVKATPKIPTIATSTFTSDSRQAIIRPRVTEKSGLLSQMGVYTFEVTKKANRAEISAAIKALYKVTPVKIALVNLPEKKVFLRGRLGTVSGIRKALVTVKKGDKIDFV
jgi:large subunit ribosomal protein L23